MNNRIVRRGLPFTCLLVCTALSAAAVVDADHEKTRVGHSITIGPGEEVNEATCFACSVRVHGHVAGDVTTFGGSIEVEDQGQIGGDATTFGGSVRLDDDAKVSGDLTVFGGRIHRDPRAIVGGDVTNFGGPHGSSRSSDFLFFCWRFSHSDSLAHPALPPALNPTYFLVLIPYQRRVPKVLRTPTVI